MVSLADYLIADSIESYKVDTIDGQSVEALFDPIELETRLAYRRTIAPDLRALLLDWTRGFVAPEHDRAHAQRARSTRAASGRSSASSATSPRTRRIAMLEPGDILVDCTGAGRCCATSCSPVTTSTRATGTRCGSGSSTRSS